MLPNEILTVDVGNSTAYAHWRGTWEPQVGQFRAMAGLDLPSYLSFMRNKFANVLITAKHWKGGIRKIYLEGVQLWSASLKSLTSAERGDLFKLSYLVGVYAGQCDAYNIGFEILGARSWKGQMTKEAVAERVLRINGMLYQNDHVTDAVGMGFSLVPEIWELRHVRQK